MTSVRARTAPRGKPPEHSEPGTPLHTDHIRNHSSTYGHEIFNLEVKKKNQLIRKSSFLRLLESSGSSAGSEKCTCLVRWPRETCSPGRPPLLFIPLTHLPAPGSARRRPLCLVHVGVAAMVPSPVITNSRNLRLPVREVGAIRPNQPRWGPGRARLWVRLPGHRLLTSCRGQPLGPHGHPPCRSGPLLGRSPPGTIPPPASLEPHSRRHLKTCSQVQEKLTLTASARPHRPTPGRAPAPAPPSPVTWAPGPGPGEDRPSGSRAPCQRPLCARTVPSLSVGTLPPPGEELGPRA